MERGYIKLWRKSMDSAAFQNPDLWKLWCLCLILANHKAAHVMIPGVVEPIKVNPGQFVTGRFSLHEAFYGKNKKKCSSPLTVWRWLQILEKAENLNIKSASKYSVITINNWDEYQSDEQQMNNRRTTDEQQVNTNKNEKNEKKKRINTYSRPDWIPEGLWESFLDNRKFKKLQNSPAALKVITGKLLEAVNAGFSIEDCIGAYISSSWQRFDVDWMRNKQGNGKQNHLRTGNAQPRTQKEQHALELLGHHETQA